MRRKDIVIAACAGSHGLGRACAAVRIGGAP